MDPLPIYKKLVLVLSFRQVQDCYKVIMALRGGGGGERVSVVEGSREVARM